MAEPALIGLALVLVLGTLAQGLAYRMQIPSILLLLGGGFLAGPVFGIVDPDALLGDALGPIVSVGVAVLLFEGGMGLDVRALRGQRRVVTRLVTLGVLITWIVGSVAAYFLLDFSIATALLLGAILVVSGPTVILPMLRHIQPKRNVDAVLRWEGIVIDPIGALLAVLVFDAAFSAGPGAGLLVVVNTLALSLVLGSAVGLLGAAVFVLIESRYWIPDHLLPALGLTLVVAVFTGAETVQSESGLFAATLMGIALANQRKVSVHHILDFKESLSMILLGSLFVLLAARVRIEDVLLLDWRALAFVATLIVVGRPLAVLVSARGSGMTARERIFLGWMAPRGIVAAAVAAFFALRLEERGLPEAALFVPITFLVIVVTVAVYGLTARALARRLHLARPDPQGVLFMGINPISSALANVLQKEDFRALLVDTDQDKVTTARLEGLEAVRADVLSVRLTDELDLGGIGRLWATTRDDETNSLAAVHFSDRFGRANCFQIAAKDEELEERHDHMRGRLLFRPGLTYDVLKARFRNPDWDIHRTPITSEFTWSDWKERHGEVAVPLFVISEGNRIRVFTGDHRPDVVPGSTLVALVRERIRPVSEREPVSDGDE